jgi:nucleotide-binding universal stress UspA family protein
VPHPTKILVGVDFSASSDAAVRHATAIARRTGAELLLVYISVEPEWPATLAEPPAALGEYYARVRAALGKERERLAELRERLSDQGLDVSHAVVDGFPETALWTTAVSAGADLIVVGSSGKSGLRWLQLGSVAQRVIRLAERDVLLARGAASAGGYRQICVATDFSPASAIALERACELAAPGGTIEVVSAWTLPTIQGFELGAATDAAALVDPINESMKERGEQLIAPHRSASLSLSFRTLIGPPAAAVIDHVSDERNDLVVVGSHGNRGVRRLVLGSVAESVARRAPCSVLVARAKEAPAS